MADAIYVPKSDILDLITEENEAGGFTDYSNYSNLWDEVDDMPAADVQPVISGDNCIVCGRDVHKDDVYYDVNGGTICEACMNTKCKCKNGR